MSLQKADKFFVVVPSELGTTVKQDGNQFNLISLALPK